MTNSNLGRRGAFDGYNSFSCPNCGNKFVDGRCPMCNRRQSEAAAYVAKNKTTLIYVGLGVMGVLGLVQTFG
eukprot:g29178.t1